MRFVQSLLFGGMGERRYARYRGRKEARTEAIRLIGLSVGAQQARGALFVTSARWECESAQGGFWGGWGVKCVSIVIFFECCTTHCLDALSVCLHPFFYFCLLAAQIRLNVYFFVIDPVK